MRLLAWGSFVLLLIHFLGWQLISNDQFSSTKRIALWQTNIPTRQKFSPNQLDRLPNAIEAALKNALQNDFEFWADNGEELNERFNAWLAN